MRPVDAAAVKRPARSNRRDGCAPAGRRGILTGMTDGPSVAQRVVSTIARAKRIDADGIRPETTFEELGLDSLDAIELLFELEEEFDLTVDDEAVQGKENVAQVIAAVEEALAAAPAGDAAPAEEE